MEPDPQPIARRSARSIRRVLMPLLAIAAVLGTVSVASAGRGASLADVRAATARFHDIGVATSAGYGPFYVCTDNETPGVGAMGQHYVRGDLVGDPRIDPLKPEALIYAPKPGGGWRLVGVEYVVIQADWHAAFGDATPTVLGKPLKAVSAPNRYGLPPFYQRHVWLWRHKPSGMFEDWNPKVSCRGTGDPA
jgi:hypothetical protein